MKTVFTIATIVSLSLLISCSSQPKLVNTQIEPEFVAPGDSIHVSVKFSGDYSDMKEVYLTVREYPYDYPMIQMRQKPQDDVNLWYEDMVIPYEAYTGEYHLDINAFLKDGSEIVTENFEENTTGKAGSILLKVK